MPKLIHQIVTFRAAPEELFDMYMDSKKHSAAIGAPACMSRRIGGKFWVFGKGAVRGRNLLVVPSRLVVQTWRADIWKDDDVNSILTLAFFRNGKGARVELVQALVPDQAFEIINTGWREHYWKPWRNYLAGR